jgi:putative membrane protein
MPSFHPHPDVWLLIGVLVTTYWMLLRWVGPNHVSPGDRPASRGQIVSFGLGVLTLWVASDWPIHDLAEGSFFTVHMVQHLLMTFVAPPLLLLGTPGWMLRWLFRPRWLMGTVRFLSRPLVALAIFNAIIAVTHWPRLVTLSVESELAHFSLHTVLVLGALLMWMPVLSPIAEVHRLSYPGAMLYLFAQSIVPTVPASFLTFGEGPLYRVYEDLPRLWGISAITDQRVAGLVMKILGGLILWGVIAVLFFRWAKRHDETGTDEESWHEVERELNRAEIGPR